MKTYKNKHRGTEQQEFHKKRAQLLNKYKQEQKKKRQAVRNQVLTVYYCVLYKFSVLRFVFVSAIFLWLSLLSFVYMLAKYSKFQYLCLVKLNQHYTHDL